MLGFSITSMHASRPLSLLLAALLTLWVACASNEPAPPPESLLIEAESFDRLGGWVLDQQFMDLMGSPYLLAHGMGVPVVDAMTQAVFPNTGRYRVWARTRDWVAPFYAPAVPGNSRPQEAPGRFQVLVDDEPLAVTFGSERAEWHWQDGGYVEIVDTHVRVALHDLTGFEGRCDALFFTQDKSLHPPEDLEELTPFRRAALGLPEVPRNGGSFDLIVVGGGVAGTSAAVTAARQGLSVALIQDRPVLGGNSSSEVRVWPEGHVNQQPYPRIGDVVMELIPDRRSDSANAQGSHVFDDDRKLQVARAEENITLFLERRMNQATQRDGRVLSVVAEHVRSGERTRLHGRWFLDSTGDGSLGYLVGADFEQTDTGHMGASNLWNIQCLCEDEEPLSSELAQAVAEAEFPRCPWAVDLSERPFPGRERGATTPEAGAGPISLGNWFWENGFDRDPIHDMEHIRDQNFRAMYGAWDAIKNVEGRYPAHRLNWVAYIAGKRESRRLLGDVILTAEDLRDGRVFEDGCFPCTWGIDTHHPDERYAEGHEGDEFIADYTRGKGYEYDGPYWVPYRCLYSRNIENLFMAGRDISVTHEALGAVRVMKTTGAMGEIVGLAAAVCKQRDCDPRAVYREHWPDLEARMQLGAGKPPFAQEGQGGLLVLSARRAAIRGRQLRYESERDCLGYWRTSADYPEWSVQLGSPRRYEVRALYACLPREAGAPAEIRVNGQSRLDFTIEPTGSWDDYAEARLGFLTLQAGEHRVTVHGEKPEGPLMKLRSLRLVPLE